MWEYCGMSRNAQGLPTALGQLDDLEKEFWSDLKIMGSDKSLNQDLEKAGRVADFFEIGKLMCHDALNRNESCGAHFREEHQTEQGEAQRDDEHFAYVAAWEYKGPGEKPELHKEALKFENVKLSVRSYK